MATRSAMQGTIRRPFFSRSERERLARAGSAVAGLVTLVSAFLVFFALSGYHPEDDGYYVATAEPTRNWVGEEGAFIADVLMKTFGVAGYFVAAFLFYWGLRLATGRYPRHALGRLVAAPFAMLALSAFASSHAAEAAAGGGLGGIVGDYLFSVLARGAPIDDGQTRLIFAATLSLLLAAWSTSWSIGGGARATAAAFRRGREECLRAVRMIAGAELGGRAVGMAGVAAQSLRERFREPDLEPSAPDAPPATRRMRAWAGAVSSALDAARERLTADRREPESTARRRDFEPIHAGPREPNFSAEPAAGPRATFSAIDDEPDAGPEFAAPRHGFGLSDAIDRAIDLDDLPSAETLETEALEADDDAPVASGEDVLAPEAAPAETPPADVDRHAALVALLEPRDEATAALTEQSLAARADRLQAVLAEYGVKGDVIEVHPGPVVSQFEVEPAPGTKAARFIGLGDDIARSMAASSARIARIAGRNTLGVELPNERRETVSLRALLEHRSFVDGAERLPLALGRDIAGAPVVADLARMPHLLIGGATGSGKSVAINTMLLSLLLRRGPDELRLLLVDPKMLELSVYDGVPHLLAPVVTDAKRAVKALEWTVREMERRYRLMAAAGVRSLESYNAKRREAGEAPAPWIVVVIDEMADLMMVAGKQIEHCVQRLAQMARASGIHLVTATQRPSVDVITGVIKANFPIRIAFQVSSKIDSRTILGEAGAEQLLGKGDMLFAAGGGRILRLHGPFVSDDEVAAVTSALRAEGPAESGVSFDEPAAGDEGASEDDADAGSDEALYAQAVDIVVREGRASTSFVQRRLQIGYNRAARLIERMEAAGVVSAPNRVGKREIVAAAR